jgi:ABC-type branched-subunit amino acid transport system substrate-binding protein
MQGQRSTKMAAILLTVATVCAQETVPRPYHDPGNAPRTYSGPGREDAEPADIAEVRIGCFGPADSGPLDGAAIWQGANLAVEEANRQGGYRGLPFRLVSAWAENPWAGGAAKLVRIAYMDKVWAIIGGIDGPTTHLAEQVVTKALLTLINPAATDRSIHTANVPWMFSCVPGDHLQAPLISRALKERGLPFVLLSATDHDSRAFVSELKLSLGRDRISPVLHVEFESAGAYAGAIAQRLLASGAKAAVIIAGARDSSALIKAVRQAGFAGVILGGPWIGRAVPDASLDGVLIPVLGDIPVAFQKIFSARYGRQPDYAAAHAFDAASLLIAAIRKAGLNRAKIRDAVQALSPFDGITGRIEWDALGQNQRPVTIRALRTKPLGD